MVGPFFSEEEGKLDSDEDEEDDEEEEEEEEEEGREGGDGEEEDIISPSAFFPLSWLLSVPPMSYERFDLISDIDCDRASSAGRPETGELPNVAAFSDAPPSATIRTSSDPAAPISAAPGLLLPLLFPLGLFVLFEDLNPVLSFESSAA